LVLFLKRTWKPDHKDGLTSLLRRGRVWSSARTEWENGLALTRAGLQVAGLVAYGEECGRLWERFSFLVTEAAPGGQTVDHFLRHEHDRARRRQVLAALAHTVRRLHAAGLASPDLFTRHLFVELEAAPPRFCFIDLARLDRRRSLPARLRARDLAALNITAPLRWASARERIHFLRAYAGSLDRSLVRRIEKRMRFLLRRRRKFRDFYNPRDENRPEIPPCASTPGLGE
jgi:tRNA A-37 threonylcarbamoyl transferase component Bud32